MMNRRSSVEYLQKYNRTDLWNLDPDRNWEADHTSKPREDNTGGQMIDRIIISRNGNIQGDITTLKDFVPGTDQRAIYGRIIVSTDNMNHLDGTTKRRR